jgi:hypothetical protein
VRLPKQVNRIGLFGSTPAERTPSWREFPIGSRLSYPEGASIINKLTVVKFIIDRGHFQSHRNDHGQVWSIL